MTGDELREAINAAISGVATHRRKLTVYMDDSGRAPLKGRSRARQPHHVKGDIHEAVSAVLDRALKSVTAGRPNAPDGVKRAELVELANDLEAARTLTEAFVFGIVSAKLGGLYDPEDFAHEYGENFRKHLDRVVAAAAAVTAFVTSPALPAQASDSPEKQR